MSKCLFSHAALVGKPSGAIARGREGAARDALLKVARYVNRLGIEVSIEADSANSVGITEFGALSVAQIGQRCDVVLAVGGDGTVLGIGRQMAAYDVPLVGINQGRLGFMTDIALDRLEELLGPVLHGEFEREERSMLHAQVMRAESTRNEAPAERVIFSANAMNDVVVSRGALAGMVELRVSVDGAFMYSQRADGLIVATPTGSTAYALSANGPIMHPRLGGFILVPIAPHSLSNRPIALPDSCTIDIEIAAGRDASVNFDMQSLTSLLHGDRIVVRRAPHSAVFLHPKGYSYFATLRSKLHWHEQN